MMAIPLSKGFSGCATTRGVEWNNEKAEEGRGKSEQVGRKDRYTVRYDGHSRLTPFYDGANWFGRILSCTFATLALQDV